MHTLVRLTPLAVLLVLPAWARGQDRNRFADVLALQEAVHQSIERAEPSIACILVSRSEKLVQYSPARPKVPGELGGFNLRNARLSLRENDPDWQALALLDLSDPTNIPESYGSGVVIDARERLVLTQAHVVRKATKIFVRLPGGRGSWADIHAADPRSDLAVLRLLDPPPSLKALRLGDGGKLRKGDFVLSLANPFAAGFRDGSPSASWGIVSNLRRRSIGALSENELSERARLPLHRFGTLIQTDTRMNLGCSGGALLNLQGELVGLTTALAGLSGGETPGGFAMPLDDGARRIIEVLRRGEEVEYGFLGVWMGQPGRVPEGRVQLEKTLIGGPAHSGGLLVGDRIIAINGTPIHDNDELFLQIGMHLAGSTIRVEAERPGGPRRICTVKLAKYGVPGQVIASKRPPAYGGLRVDWTSTLPLHWNHPMPQGVVIREVQANSPADKARLQPRMVIQRVNDSLVQNPADFCRAMEKANGPIELTYLPSPSQQGTDRVTIDSKESTR
jgi:S1-C subfamily serine protease